MRPENALLFAPLVLAACLSAPHEVYPDKTEVVILEFAPADEVAKTIQELYGSDVEVVVDERTNAVLVKGAQVDLVGVKDVITRLDVERR